MEETRIIRDRIIHRLKIAAGVSKNQFELKIIEEEIIKRLSQ